MYSLIVYSSSKKTINGHCHNHCHILIYICILCRLIPILYMWSCSKLALSTICCVVFFTLIQITGITPLSVGCIMGDLSIVKNLLQNLKLSHCRKPCKTVSWRLNILWEWAVTSSCLAKASVLSLYLILFVAESVASTSRSSLWWSPTHHGIPFDTTGWRRLWEYKGTP